MMVINGNDLVRISPIKDMIANKANFEGTSYGLSEAGYDIRIAQDIHFIPGLFKRVRIIEDNLLTKIEWFNSFCLASAIEEFEMPETLVGMVYDKSTWARKGLSLFNTVIEPGWKGILTLELAYHGSESLYIKKGQGIAQVIFHTLLNKANYGNGKYQNQTGITRAKFG
jgi:dCTP deaminase